MAKRPFVMTGGNDVLDNLARLPRATQSALLRRMAKKALAPIASRVKAKAPVKYGDLAESLVVGSKLNKRQRSINSAGKSTVEVHFGTSDPAGVAVEFGNEKQAAQPFFRSEWEGGKAQALRTIETDFGNEILKTVKRVADRRARQ